MASEEFNKGYVKALHDVKRLLKAVNESKRVTFSYWNIVKLFEIACENREKILENGDFSDVFYDRFDGFFIKKGD